MEGIDGAKPPIARTAGHSKVISGDMSKGSVTGYAQIGSGTFTGSPVASISPERAADGSEGFTINLLDAPVSMAAKKVLGEILGYNYLIDPKVSGTITLQTSNPVSKHSLIDILEVALATNGAAIVKKADRYEILPISEATASNSIVSGARLPRNEPGMKVQVIQLIYIAADEMKDIIEQVSKKGAVLRTDPTLVAGNGGELSANIAR